VDGSLWQSYQHDAFRHVNQRNNRFWSRSDLFTASYTNNRKQGWSYDAAGNVLANDEMGFSYDAAGRNYYISGESGSTLVWLTLSSDGDGQGVKRFEDRYNYDTNTSTQTTTYYLRSSVLGGRLVTELNAQGQKQKGYVYAGGELLALQNYSVSWRHENPVTSSRGSSGTNGFYSGEVEFDPAGVNVGFSEPPPPPPGGFLFNLSGIPILLGGFEPVGSCVMDGIDVPCAMANAALRSGGAVLCPSNDCGPRTVYVDLTYDSGRRETYSGLTDPFAAYGDGRSGFMLGGMLVQEGYNESFRGMAAQAAARSFFNGMANGGFATAVHDALRSGFLVREFISYFTDPQETGQKPRCIFNVNLEVTDPSLTAADIEKIKAEMAGIFHAAGHGSWFSMIPAPRWVRAMEHIV